MPRTLWPFVALALIVLLSAGCGSDAASGTGPAATQATDREQAVKFAECIRRHGVRHFPDPNAKGEFVFGIDVSPAVWRKAVAACKDLQRPGALDAKRTPKQQSAALEFAQCIRANGVKDFPDPVNGQPLVDTTRIPSTGSDAGMTVLNAAMHKCGDRLAKAAAGQ
jgi:hypothetical protein